MPVLYEQLADALLGAGVRPFASFRAPADMAPSYWYGSNFAINHQSLANKLVDHAGPDGWVLELGSFIGMSAVAWAQASQNRGWRTPVVCVDTWLGDLVMWEQKQLAMGQGGAPRLWEQFMLNVAGKNASSHVLPLRMPATIALEYILRRVASGEIPPPAVIYDDTAHTYPETLMELRQAWQLLAPGGYLTGDDYTHHFPPVQQSVNEFAFDLALTLPPAASWASTWPSKHHLRMRQVTLLPPRASSNLTGSVSEAALAYAAGEPKDADGGARYAYVQPWRWGERTRAARSGGSGGGAIETILPMMLFLPGQWLMRKPERAAGALSREATRSEGTKPPPQLKIPWERKPLRCCLNGWLDYGREHECRRGGASRKQMAQCAEAMNRESRYTKCNVAPAPLQQATCHLPSARTECIEKFACHSLPGGTKLKKGKRLGGR